MTPTCKVPIRDLMHLLIIINETPRAVMRALNASSAAHVVGLQPQVAREIYQGRIGHTLFATTTPTLLRPQEAEKSSLPSSSESVLGVSLLSSIYQQSQLSTTHATITQVPVTMEVDDGEENGHYVPYKERPETYIVPALFSLIYNAVCVKCRVKHPFRLPAIIRKNLLHLSTECDQPGNSTVCQLLPHPKQVNM
ncbi:hypothetical protein B566_EDAN008101 [Ephemera danica]|nr:hypothetical protein B566_EDAN008101 [Ephemera danica]